MSLQRITVRVKSGVWVVVVCVAAADLGSRESVRLSYLFSFE